MFRSSDHYNPVGALRQMGHHVHRVGGIDSHVHILIGYNIVQHIPEMMRQFKANSSRFINDSHIIPYKFSWQSGYGCFSHSRSQIMNVCSYIDSQHEHHKSVTIEDEIKRILDNLGMEYDARYLIRDPQ